MTDGPHLTPRFWDNGIPFLSVNNLAGNRIDLTDLRFISEADHELFSGKCKPRKDDILLGKAASVGKVAIVELDYEFNISYQLLSFESAANTRRVSFITNSRALTSLGKLRCSQIHRLKETSGWVISRSCTLKLPPLPEQTAIATVLSDMDAELAALEQRLTKTRALKHGVIQELLTGRTRLL